MSLLVNKFSLKKFLSRDFRVKNSFNLLAYFLKTNCYSALKAEPELLSELALSVTEELFKISAVDGRD